jgi:hypothetical protein
VKAASTYSSVLPVHPLGTRVAHERFGALFGSPARDAVGQSHSQGSALGHRPATSSPPTTGRPAGGVPAAISMLGRALSSTIAVIDSDAQVLAVHGSDSARVIRHARAIAGPARSAPGPRRPTSKVIADDHGYCTVQSISANDLRGYLAVSSGDPLSPSDRLLVAHTVSSIPRRATVSPVSELVRSCPMCSR